MFSWTVEDRVLFWGGGVLFLVVFSVYVGWLMIGFIFRNEYVF